MLLTTAAQALAAKAATAAAALPAAGGTGDNPGQVAGISVDTIKNLFLFGVVPVAGLIIMAGMIFNARKQKASDNAITLTNVLMALGVGFLCVGGGAWLVASTVAGQVVTTGK